VYIPLPNDQHAEWTLRAAAAGKHVLCEKPLALDGGQVREMSAAAAGSDRLLVEATWSRWHPRTRRAEALLAAGELGAVLSVDTGFTFSGVPEGNYRLDVERGGGALYDVGPYAVGAALCAVPDGAVEVREVEVVRHARGVDLTTSARLRAGEADAVVRTSIDEEQGEWIRIVGERATMVLDPPAHTSWLAPSTLTVREAEGELVLHFGPVDAYQVMVEHVSRAIRGDRNAWLLPLADSLRVAEALDAIRSAAA
jgi:xylose dehydrogenase (NAD/NADP)